VFGALSELFMAFAWLPILFSSSFGKESVILKVHYKSKLSEQKPHASA